jgi:thioredoxin reductase
MIAHTELAMAHSYGRMGVAKDAGADKKIWLLSADHDPKEDCFCSDAAEAGEVPIDEPFVDGEDDYVLPPGHPNAILGGTTFVSYGFTKQMVRSSYKGPAILIEAASCGSSAKMVSVTIGPNHPILTRRGFVKAAEIAEGDELLYDVRSEIHRPLDGLVTSNFKNVPIVEQAFEALISIFGNTRIASAANYFHGDEEFIYGEIDVVRPTRSLLPVFDPSGIEQLRKCDLSGADTDAKHVSGCSSCQSRFNGIFLTASGDMSVAGKGSAAIRPYLVQPLFERARAFLVSLFGVGGSGPSASLLRGQGCVIPFQSVRVVSRHKVSYTGFAFDSSTESGLYNNNGLVVSNCLCDWSAIYPADKIAKYSPDQPRVPAGQPGGGEFGSDGGEGTTSDLFPREGTPHVGDEEKFKALKLQWAQVNEGLRQMMDNPGSPEAKAKLEQLKEISKQMYELDANPGGIKSIGLPGPQHDLLIVGGGPAGLSAAINAGAEGLNTVLVDANERPGGQARYSSRVENFAGFPIGVTGRELTTQMTDQAQRLGADIKSNTRVVGLSYDPKTGLKTVTLSDGTTEQAKAVVLAGGLEFRKLSFEGSDSPGVITGDGEKLAQVTVGKPAVVVGGSNGAAQAALGVAQQASHVYLMARSPIVNTMSDYQIQALKAQTIGPNPKITIMEGDEVKSLSPTDDKQYDLTTTKGETIHTAAVGVFIGSGPTTSWLPPSILSDAPGKDRGRVVVNTDYETKIPGVYAVGDTIVNGPERIMASAGQGQIAVRNLFQYFARLEKEQDKATVTVKLAKKSSGKGVKEWNAIVDALYDADVSDVDKFQPDVPDDAIAKYSESQPRDKDGKWTTDGDSATPRAKPTKVKHPKKPVAAVGDKKPFDDAASQLFHSQAEAHKFLEQPGLVFFHGTSSALEASIKKNGLIPAGGEGADTWAMKHGMVGNTLLSWLERCIQDLRPSYWPSKSRIQNGVSSISMKHRIIRWTRALKARSSQSGFRDTRQYLRVSQRCMWFTQE